MEDDPLHIKEEILEEHNSLKECSVVIVKQELDDLLDDLEEDQEVAYDENDLVSSDEGNSDSDFELKESSRSRSRSSRTKKLDETECEGCQRTFKSRPNLNKHLGQNQSCKSVYEASGNLPACFANPRRKLDPSELEVECKKCKKTFASEGSLNRHVSKIKPCKRFYDKLNGVEDVKTDGLTPRQSYYKRNRERVILRQKEYYRRNAERVKERRIQHYRSRAVQATTLMTNEANDSIVLQKGTGYMEKHKEYYEKNKEVIKERRRNYYHSKKEALTRKVGRHEFAKISAVKNLAEIPDPFEAYGKVRFDIPLAVSNSKKKKINLEFEDDDIEVDMAEVEKNASSTTSPLNNCLGSYGLASKPGASKINFDSNLDEDLATMPIGSKLSAKPFEYANVQNVESFVGLSLSEDGESIEICHLLERNNITLEAVQKLVHGLLSVLSIDLKTFVQERSCPVNLFEIRHMHLLKDRLTRDLMAANNVLPEPATPLCTPVASSESDFLDESMTSEIPHDQLIVNEQLLASDLGAIGVQWRLPDDHRQVRINPLFSINSVDHWRLQMRHFYTLLVNWVGGKVALNQIFHLLPCMISAKEAFFDEVRLECHAELLKPMETKICEHCGEVFQFSKYTLQTRRAYARHVQLHDHNCKICGETFPNGTQRKFHERSHKEHSVRCSHENCHYVGSSQQAVDTHVKHAHSNVVCDLCGKVTVAQNLKLHMSTHHAPKTFEFICAVCGKGYSTKNILDKHLKRHNNPDSLINKWMTEPSEFKFECKEHENCKKFFKSEKRLKEHLKKYGGKSYPSNLARQYVPNLPDNHSTVVDSTSIQAKPALVKENKPKSKDTRPYKKRPMASNRSSGNVKVETIAANLMANANANHSDSSDSYQPPSHLSHHTQSLYHAQQQLFQSHHDFIQEHIYGGGGGSFRHQFPDSSSSSNHANY